jgi:hypothetical protein
MAVHAFGIVEAAYERRRPRTRLHVRVRDVVDPLESTERHHAIQLQEDVTANTRSGASTRGEHPAAMAVGCSP